MPDDDIPPPPTADLPSVPNWLPAQVAVDGRDDDFRTRSYFGQPPETRTGFPGEQPTIGHVPDIPGFTILDELGSGGMGVVYKAQHHRLNRTVALKVIRHDLTRHADGDALRRRFAEEALSLARLQHPHIVQIHDAGEHEGQPYLVMEYVAGGGLDTHVRGGKLPPPAVAAEMVRTLARAVQAAHDRHIVHRDLKPSNVLVAPDGALKIADFGLAKLLDDTTDGTARHSVVGTPGYMAPEQVRGEPVGPLIDIYALGAILYKLLVNHPPFSADTLTALDRLVCETSPTPPRQQQPRIPKNLEAICLKCLEKEPARRYQSAAALAEDLDRYLQGKPITARPVGWWRRQEMWARRKPAAAALLVTMVLLFAVSGALAAVAAKNAVQDLNNRRIEAEKKVADTEAEASAFAARVNEAEQRAAPERVVTQPGWRSHVLSELRIAAASRPAAQQAERLRTLLAGTEARIDLEEVGTVAENVNPFCLAVSPDGTKVAVGDSHGALGAVVRLYFADGRTIPQTIRDGIRTGDNGIRALALSPDGRWLAAGSRGGKLFAWDTEQTAAPRIDLESAGQGITAAAFSSDGARLVAISEDSTLRVWDTTNWKHLHTLSIPVGRKPFDIAFSPDAKQAQFITADEGGGSRDTVRALRSDWKQPANAKTLSPGNAFRFVRYTPNGDFVALAGGSRILLFNLAGFYPTQWLTESPSGGAHSGEVRGLSIDPAGTLLASGGADNYLKIWDVTTGQLLLRLFIPGDEGALPVFVPATGELLIAANQKITRYRVILPNTFHVVGPQTAPVGSVTFVKDGSTIASVSRHFRPGVGGVISEIGVWDVDTGKARARKPYPPLPGDSLVPLPSIAVVPGGSTVVGVGMPRADLLVWDWSKEPEPQGFMLAKPRVAFNSFAKFVPDGTMLWGAFRSPTEPDRVRILNWPDRTDRLAQRDELSELFAARSGYTCLDVGRWWAALGSADCSVKLIRTAAPTEPWRSLPTGGENPAHSVALSPDESLVLAGTRRGQVAAFRLPGGEPLDTPIRHFDRVEAIAFAPDGKLVATGGRDNRIRLWERSGELFRSLVTYPAHGPIIDLKFSPDGRRLAFVVENQRAFNVWDLGLFRQNLGALGLDW